MQCCNFKMIETESVSGYGQFGEDYEVEYCPLCDSYYKVEQVYLGEGAYEEASKDLLEEWVQNNIKRVTQTEINVIQDLIKELEE